MGKLVTRISMIALLGAAFVVVQGLPGTGTVSECEAQGNSGCEGDEKIENAGTIEHDSIESICIKAGRGVFNYACGETDSTGCYDIQWTEVDGCCTAVVSGGGGTGRDCKSISHTSASFGEPCEPSPSPSPPAPSPSPPAPSPGP